MSAFERLLEQKGSCASIFAGKGHCPGNRCFWNGIYGRKDHRKQPESQEFRFMRMILLQLF